MRPTVRYLPAPVLDNVAVQIGIFPCQRTQRGVELTVNICVASSVQNKLLQKFRNVLIIHYQSITIVSEFYYTSGRRTCLSSNVSHFLLSLLVYELEFKIQAMNLIKSITARVDLHYTLKFSSYLRQNKGLNSQNYQQVNYNL